VKSALQQLFGRPAGDPGKLFIYERKRSAGFTMRHSNGRLIKAPAEMPLALFGELRSFFKFHRAVRACWYALGQSSGRLTFAAPSLPGLNRRIRSFCRIADTFPSRYTIASVDKPSCRRIQGRAGGKSSPCEEWLPPKVPRSSQWCAP